MSKNIPRKKKKKCKNDDDYEKEDDEAPKYDKSKKSMTTVALFVLFIPYKMKDALERGF